MSDIDFSAILQARKARETKLLGTQITLDARTPDGVAERATAAKELGVPSYQVPMDPAAWKRQVDEKRLQRALEKAPDLARWMSKDPDGAAMARDDMESLGYIDRVATSIVEGNLAVAKVAEDNSAAIRSLKRGAIRVGAAPDVLSGMQAASVLADMGKTEAQILDEISPPETRVSFPPPMQAEMAAMARDRVAKAKSYEGRASELVTSGSESLARARKAMDRAAAMPMSAPAKAFSDSFMGDTGPKDLGGILDAFAGDPIGGGLFLAETAGEFIPVMLAATATTAATRSPMIGAAFMGAGSGLMEMSSSGMEFLQEQGVDVSTPEAAARVLQDADLMAKATQRGLARAIPIAIMDALSGGIASKTLAKTPLGNMMAQGVVQAGFGGGGEALAQVNAGQEFDLRDVVVEALAEVVTAPLEVLGVGGRGLLGDAKRASKAGDTKSVLERIDAGVLASKLAKRSPEQFADLMSNTGLGATDLHIPAEDLKTYFQGRDITPMDWGLEGDIFEEAVLAGGSVSIPASVYASKISGTEHAAWVHENARMDPDGFSMSDGEAFDSGVRDVMQAAWDEAMSLDAEARDRQSSDVRVYDAMFSQLRAAGRTPDVAEREAQMLSSFFTTMGERYGEDPLDLMTQMGMSIAPRMVDTPPRRRDTLDIALNALRAGQTDPIPKGRRIIDFVRNLGGIRDDGGDLGSMDMPKGIIAETAAEVKARRSQPEFGGLPAQGKGRGLDEMTAAAIDAGFLPEGSDTNDMLAALAQDQSGDAVFALGDEPKTPLADLQRELSRLGIDETQTNDEIIAALEASGGRSFNQFAGPKANGAPPLDEARVMLADGASPDEILAATGWAVGADGRLRFEISDDAAGLIGPAVDGARAGSVPPGYNASPRAGFSLRDVMQHDRLFEAYPFLADVRITSNTGLQSRTGGLAGVSAMAGGSAPMEIQIDRDFWSGTLDPDIQARADAMGLDLRNVLLHEIQHIIQIHEGFAFGDVAAAGKSADGVPQVEVYNRLAGEVEARNTVARSNMTPEQRAASPAADTADVAVSDQIVVEDVSPLDAQGVDAARGRIAAAKAEADLQPMLDRARRAASEYGAEWDEMTGGSGPTLENVTLDYLKGFGADFTPKQVAFVERALAAQDGQTLFQPAPATDSAAFKEWFGDSKVVDADGKPLVVYHGTKSAGFDAFNVDGQGKTSGTGAFFTESVRGAATYSGTKDEFSPVSVEQIAKSPAEYGFEVEDARGEWIATDPNGDTFSAETYEDALAGSAEEWISAGGGKEAGNYAVYLQIANPLVIDADGANWDSIGSSPEFFVSTEDGESVQYFTDKSEAEAWAEDEDNIEEYGPLSVVEEVNREDAGSTDDIVRSAREDGYDGVIFENVTDEGPFGQGYGWDKRVFVAFSPTQIKSVNNRGTFDGNDPRILFQSEDGAVALNSLADEGNNEAIITKALMDGAGANTKKLSDVLEGMAQGSEPDGLVGTPSHIGMVPKVLSAGLEDPKVFDAVVSLASVDVVNMLFGSEGAAKMALHDEAVLKDAPALNADLPVSGSKVDAAGPVGLLIGDAARSAAKLLPVSLGARRKSLEASAAQFTGQGETFRQDASSSPRASITFPSGGLTSGQTIIKLFDSANLSSVIHESGHFFLEAFNKLASAEDAPQGMKDDLAAIFKWLELPDGADITTEAHEKWARGFEAYALEGKAPSLELADAFSRFKSWLMTIYRSALALNVKLTPEVRGVMDRMLATDEAIALARDTEAMRPLFRDEGAAGMSKEAWQAYQRLARRSQEQAEQSLLEKTMAKIRRQREAWYRAESKEVRTEVEASLAKERQYRLIAAMANQDFGDESDGPDIRLDRAELISIYGKGVLEEVGRSRLGGKRAIYAVGGTPLGEAAELFGFASVDEMVSTLQNTVKFKDAVNAEVDRIMTERHGDPLSDGSIEEEALIAIHSEQQANTVAAEARQLAKRAGKPHTNITAQVFRQRARMMLGRMSVRQATKPTLFLAAERRARAGAEQAFARVAKGALNEKAALKSEEALAIAMRFKEQELLSHMLYVEALQAEKEVSRAREKMRDYDKKKVRAKLAGDYIEQIDALLEAYDFRVIGVGKLARRASLLDYINKMTEAGREAELSIDERLIDDARSKHYSQMSMDEFRGLTDTIANIDHMGRFKQKLIEAKKQRDIDEVVSGVVGALNDNVQGSPPSRGTPTTGEKQRKTFRDYLNLTLNADTLLREIDGFTSLGPAWRALKESIDAAQSRLIERRHQMAISLDKLFGAYTRAEQADMQVRRHVKSLGGAYSKWDIIGMALNTGNEANWERLTNPKSKGSFQPAAINAALAEVLDGRDWAFVQSTWDYIDTFWPEIEAKERRLTGTAPKKVEAKMMSAPVSPGVALRGGYYPIKYDGRLSGLVDDREQKALAEASMGGRFGKAQTANGHTKARAVSVSQPVKLDISVMFSHLNDVLYDIEMGEAVSASWRVLQDGRIREAFMQKGKTSDWEALEIWLLDTASGERTAARGLEVYLRHIRSGFTFSRLALNVSTALIQPSGLAQSAVVVGKKAMLNGMVSYLSNPNRWSRDVMQASAMMRERQTTFERDMFNIIGEIEDGPVTGRWGKFKRDFLVPWSFWMMQKVQFYSVDVPTWVAAYEDYTAQGKTETQARTYADMMVKRAQGSGIMSDRGMLERGTVAKDSRQREWPRMLTALGSYMFAKFNVAYESGMRTDFKSPADLLRFTSDIVLLFTFEAMLYSLVKGQLPDEKDDESLAEYAAKQTALGMLGTLPVAREFASSLSGFGAGGVFGSSIETFGRLILQMQQVDFDKALLKAAVGAVGVGLHLPSSQANLIIDALFNEKLEPRDGMLPIDFLRRPPK